MNNRLLTIMNKFCSNRIEIVNRIKFRKNIFVYLTSKLLRKLLSDMTSAQIYILYVLLFQE